MSILITIPSWLFLSFSFPHSLAIPSSPVKISWWQSWWSDLIKISRHLECSNFHIFYWSLFLLILFLSIIFRIYTSDEYSRRRDRIRREMWREKNPRICWYKITNLFCWCWSSLKIVVLLQSLCVLTFPPSADLITFFRDSFVCSCSMLIVCRLLNHVQYTKGGVDDYISIRWDVHL